MLMRKAMYSGAMLAAALLINTAAQAEVVRSPDRALQLLTEARVAAEKCGWLSAGERRELVDYAARAELETVRRQGTEAAKTAVKRGKAMGGAGCTAERKELVTAVLQGAREALRRQRTAQARPAAAPRRVQQVRERRRERTARHARVARVQRASWNGPVARVARPADDLARYRVMAATYYHALKCRNRPQGELMRMWRRVRDLHFAILNSGRKAALARAKARARREGNSRACR